MESTCTLSNPEFLKTHLDPLYRAFIQKHHIPGLVYGVIKPDGEIVHSLSHGVSQLSEEEDGIKLIQPSTRNYPSSTSSSTSSSTFSSYTTPTFSPPPSSSSSSSSPRSPISPRSCFRIASMTKSFTALAVLRLRDSGLLPSLDLPLSALLPSLPLPPPLTSDCPSPTVLHLLTMTPGFPQDDPWADRLLSLDHPDHPDHPVHRDHPEFPALVAGAAYSTPTGTAFEYSNLAYALLGALVAALSGVSYQRYVSEAVFAPLGMRNTFWDAASVPDSRLVCGYRLAEGPAFLPEEYLADGAFAAMGGVITCLEDMARYAALHLSAYPARDVLPGEGAGPVLCRASLREMHQGRVFAGFSHQGAFAESYALGLRWCTGYRAAGLHWVRHGGGLPGFGCEWRFFPQLGVALVCMTSLTYAPVFELHNEITASLISQGALAPPALTASRALKASAEGLLRFLREPLGVQEDEKDGTGESAGVGGEEEMTWRKYNGLFAHNVFKDISLTALHAEAQGMFQRLGDLVKISEIAPLNALRGLVFISNENGDKMSIFFTLSPESPPKIQKIEIQFIPLIIH